MKKTSSYVLRIGLAVTFIWIGVLILKQPEAWGGYLEPWVLRILPIPLGQIMFGTALLDIAIGVSFFINPLVWLAALIGGVHLIGILIVSGITDITVRDIAILAATIALFIDINPFRKPGDQNDQGRSSETP